MFMKFQSDSQRESYDDFPKSPIWEVIWKLAKTINVLDHIFENIEKQ